MMIVTIKLDWPIADTLAIKEALAMEAENYGTVRDVMVEEIVPKQQSFL